MKVQPKTNSKTNLSLVTFLLTSAKQVHLFFLQASDDLITFFCSILNGFIVTFNPNWIHQFTENQLGILDKWIANRNIQLQLFLIYLAIPFLHFDEDCFIIRITNSQRAIAFLNLLFASLFGFFTLLLTYAALYSHTSKGFWILIGLAINFAGVALGLTITQADKYAAIFIQRTYENEPFSI